MDENISNIKKKIEKELGFELMRDPNPMDCGGKKQDYILDRLSHLHYNPSNTDKAQRLLLRGLHIDPKNEIFWATLGYIYYIKGDFKRSIKCFFKTIEINPINIDNWIDLGFAYRAYGDAKTSDFIFVNYTNMIRLYYDRFDKMNNLTLLNLIKMLMN